MRWNANSYAGVKLRTRPTILDLRVNSIGELAAAGYKTLGPPAQGRDRQRYAHRGHEPRSNFSVISSARSAATCMTTASPDAISGAVAYVLPFLAAPFLRSGLFYASRWVIAAPATEGL
jgi:hypothetical protein